MHLCPAQTDSQVDASFRLGLWLPSFVELRWNWSSSNSYASRRKFFTVWPPNASRHKLIASHLYLVYYLRLFATCVHLRADLAIRLAIHRNSVQFLVLPTRCWLASTWDPVWPGLKQTRTVNGNVGRRSKYFFVIFVSIPSFWFNTLFVSILSETQLPLASSSSWTKQYIDTRSCKVDNISIKTAWMEMEQFKSLTRIARHRIQLYLRILSCVNKSLILLCWSCCRRRSSAVLFKILKRKDTQNYHGYKI